MRSKLRSIGRALGWRRHFRVRNGAVATKHIFCRHRAPGVQAGEERPEKVVQEQFMDPQGRTIRRKVMLEELIVTGITRHPSAYGVERLSPNATARRSEPASERSTRTWITSATSSACARGLRSRGVGSRAPHLSISRSAARGWACRNLRARHTTCTASPDSTSAFADYFRWRDLAARYGYGSVRGARSLSGP